jgi:predicted amidohydrolase
MSWDSPALLVGFAEQQEGHVHNSLAVIRNGKIEAVYRKGLLPNYGVFDEKRYLSRQASDYRSRLMPCRIVCREDIGDID